MRWLFALVLVLLAANVIWWAWRGQPGPLWSEHAAAADAEPPAPVPVRPADAGQSTGAHPPTTAAPDPPQAPPGVPRATPVSGTSAPPSPTGPPAPNAAAPSGLVVPVQGIAPGDLADTFGDARSGERMHEALDIMAPAGTPVLAVADGHVEKLFDSERGGLTVYQFEPSGAWCYYYAHLQSYAPGLAEGQALKRGDVIGFVGSSGNADPAAPHLHFAVFALTPERQWWTGTPVNPYPLLTGAPTR
ncbi:M23 family metallopeptidase [Luteimonas kalidii]|uniref:M23 family metallopeptidase n=1 Tax=Luteimonas kalidii TaxID=3042025 RepID=A0ABT6JWR6_9GAMM|nr:M23 family metallopeptidase [Luteimonas kalidii]MDH5835128.1 M23 family metallopeptidase [Luteimonas kalidii]